MRRPSLQFYPGDWQSNPKLRRCSHAEKGIWLDVLCILHDQDEYGVIHWPLRDLALAVHARTAALQGLADKGVLKGTDSGECEPFIFIPRHGRKDGTPVTLVAAQSGPIWYSSRMVRDEYVRQVRADNEPSPKAAPKVGAQGGLGTSGRSHPSRGGAGAAVSSSSSSASSSSPAGRDQPSPKGDAVKSNEDFTIWNLGVKKIAAVDGVTEQSARGFLGEQIKNFGKSEVARAVVEALGQEAVEPKAYIVAVLQGKNGTRRGTSNADQNLDAASRIIEEIKGRQHGTRT